ncbi:hypothetical protein ACU5AX_07810 [Sphingomonas sp. XXL09]|uniref:hypothetical protein n=1 Tax=Sphingomonas sp. XXL09 TaxID=3457787 RepID=UPI00406BA7BA
MRDALLVELLLQLFDTDDKVVAQLFLRILLELAHLGAQLDPGGEDATAEQEVEEPEDRAPSEWHGLPPGTQLPGRSGG